MLNVAYRDLFLAIATCAASLTGLLFVAMTVARHHSPADRPVVIEQVRAAASILAFTNALAVSLFALVPGNNAGYAAVVVAVIGIFFTAAGTRSIFSGHVPWHHVPRQLALITLLLATFAFEFAGGIDLILNPHSNGAAELISNLLAALLIIGVARAWELVGDRDTNIIASIAVLTGHDATPMAPPASAPPEPAETKSAGDLRTADTHRDTRPPAVSSTSLARGNDGEAQQRLRRFRAAQPVRSRGYTPNPLHAA